MRSIFVGEFVNGASLLTNGIWTTKICSINRMRSKCRRAEVIREGVDRNGPFENAALITAN